MFQASFSHKKCEVGACCQSAYLLPGEINEQVATRASTRDERETLEQAAKADGLFVMYDACTPRRWGGGMKIG